MLPPCEHCHGWCYKEDPAKPKSDVWCLMCGRWIPPPAFKPLPYISRNEEPSFVDQDWYIDEHGDIIDIIDRRIEHFITEHESFTVSAVAKKINCAISEAHMTLDRLVRNGVIEKYVYGPQNRWTGYRRIGRTYG